MKTKNTTILIAKKLLLAGPVIAACLVTSPSLGRAEGVFTNMVIGGRVRTNVSVVRVNPIEVTLHWQGGGCSCKRQDLPSELAARYPYDAEKAAQWARETAAQNAELGRRSAELRRAAILGNFKRKEAGLKAQIQTADKELQTLNEIIPVLAAKSKGTRRNSLEHADLDRARDRKIELINQIHNTQSELSATQAQMAQIP